MIENGGTIINNNTNNDRNTSFRQDEPPPDPDDFGTREEEIKNRELLAHLLEQQKKRREIADRLTQEEKISKELEEERRIKELVSQKAYYERRNASARYRSMACNERIKQMLNKVDEYMRKISNLDSIDKIKEEAQKEFEEEIKKSKRKITKKEIENLAKLNKKNEGLRNDNKKRIEERKKNELLLKEKLRKAKIANERAEKILKNGYKLPKGGDDNNDDKNVNIRSGGLGIFQEEGDMIGTNLAPNMMMNNNVNNANNKNKLKRPNSAYKFGKNNLMKANDEDNINPEEKLKAILKKNPNDLKELLKFQKKYKYIEIGQYIHKAKMNLMKQKKKKSKKIFSSNINQNNINNNSENDDADIEGDVDNNNEDNKDVNNKDDNNNNNQILFQEEQIGSGDTAANPQTQVNRDNNILEENNEIDGNKSKEKKKKKKKKKKKNINTNYLEACKYNNDDCIKSLLLNAKDDEEVFKIVNERDDSGRNGLMYLLIHNNSNMIKLILLSGVILDDSKDIYGRNLIHYCCTDIVDKSMLDIICHCIDFKRFGDLCSYVNKCIPIVKRKEIDIFSPEFQDECEERIKNFDDLIENKENGQKKIVPKNNKNNSGDKVNIAKMVNSPDIDGNYPIHYLAKDDNMEKMDVLIYFHANLDVLDNEGNKPINLTQNKVIQQFLLKNEQNIKSKNPNKYNNNINGGEQIHNNNNNNININNSIISIDISSLDIDKIKYFSPEKINSFFVGVESNSYLILSVIQEKYDLFKFLITEKNAKVDYVNGNGWTILFFIVTKKLWNFFAFLFQLENPDQCDTPEKIYNELTKKNYEKIELMENNGDLTYLGQAIKILDNLSNKNENILSICIDEYDDIFILKSMLILYDYYILYFAMNEPKNVVFQRQYGKYDESSYLNIIFNRQYGKNKETYLIKYVKKKDLKTIKYLLDELCRGENKLNLDIYKGDCNNQNMLHHAVLLKQKEIIKYLIKYDSDNNFLKTNKDSKGKTPIDLDRTKTFENEYYTVWDAAKKNDVDLLKKLIKDLKYYEVNEQTYINKNTPLHMAVKYKADRAILYLLKEGGDKDKKNINGHTPMNTIEKVQFPDRKWIKIAKKILDGEIKEFVQLDKLKVDKYMDSNNTSKLSNGKEKKKKLGEELKKDMRLLELLSMIKEQINNNKMNIKELFDQLDKNKNGSLSFKEFKKLFTKLNIDEINEEDIIYIMSHLDSNKDGKLQYKEFLNLLI